MACFSTNGPVRRGVHLRECPRAPSGKPECTAGSELVHLRECSCAPSGEPVWTFVRSRMHLRKSLCVPSGVLVSGGLSLIPKRQSTAWRRGKHDCLDLLYLSEQFAPKLPGKEETALQDC